MPDAVKVGFVPFSGAPRGILVVFCDDALKFGAATAKALGPAAAMIKRAAAANQFKGKSGSTLDFLAPEGVKASRLIIVGAGKLSGHQGQRLPQARRYGGRQASPGQRGRDHHRRIAERGDEARSGGRRCRGRAAARLQIRSLQDQKEGRRGRGASTPRSRSRSATSPPRKRPLRPTITSSTASSSRAIW